MTKNKKVPSAADKLAKAKEPKFAKQFNVQSSPLWDFSKIDTAGDFPFGVGQLYRDNAIEIYGKIHNWSKMTWFEIDSAEKQKSHFLSYGSLTKAAKDRLTCIKREDDAEALYSLRLSGQQRLIGFRYQSVFSVLWFDPLHQVAISIKKHT